MAYVNTGIQRAKTLTVNKTVSGISITGYPATYSILDEFTPPAAVGQVVETYPLLNETQFQQLTSGEYAMRLNAFKSYIQWEEGISDLDAITDSGTPADQENTTACPIGA